jgi:5'-nucleotidase/UDP-sugar diphosphatase
MRKVVLFVLVASFVLPLSPASAQDSTVVTLIHFADYHSYAVPFYAEGQPDSAGIARLLAYLQPFADDEHTLILNGGDMLNVGALGWSDKYQCVEWAWFNGVSDAMALGNHDADYGSGAFADCQAQIDYPILGANVLDAAGESLFEYDDQTYLVFEIADVKIGVFAVAGPDFELLVKPEVRPAEGVAFGDPVAAARDVVETLRDVEEVNAVVLIGHSHYEDDIALAQAVPGIDVIFGTHSHRKEALTLIPGSSTYYISAFQYLTYLSKLELTFSDGVLSDVQGELVQMANTLPQDQEIAQQVAQMQADLEADPDYADRYLPIGKAAIELSTEGQFEGEALLGNLVMDIYRSTTEAHMAVATASSFRQPIPPGVITEEQLRRALPYANVILVYDMTGAQIQELLDYSVSRSESDSFSQVSGVRFVISDGRATNIELLSNPLDPSAGYGPLDPAATYKVATNNYQGLYAGGYKDIFEPASYVDTGIDVRDEVRKLFQEGSPVSSQLGGRITVSLAPEPATLPESGGALPDARAIVLLGVLMAALGLSKRRQASPTL